MIAYTEYAIDARVRREAETLAAHGFRVLCLTNRNGQAPRNFLLNGVEVDERGAPKYQGKSAVAYLGSYVRFLATASAVCLRLKRLGHLDVIHAHNMPDFLVFAGLVPRARGSKVVLDVHDSIPETFASKFSGGQLVWRSLCVEERFSALVAHRVVCVNHPQRDTLVARGIPAEKTFVSMNVPDPRIFGSRPADRLPRCDGTFNLVYHGTMAKRLGVDLLIQAVERLRGRIPGLRLHLWGPGDDVRQFQSLAEALGLGDQVRFLPGGYPLVELPARLGTMDIGVVGNRRNVAGELMLPVKLLEYVALGIPAVVPRLRTISHYFADDMVAYYEPDDVGSMAEAIYRLYSEPDVRREQVRRADAFLETYGWERQGPELVSLYRQLLEN
jgi:glycosyltransferase involved in cell wall biosynthesis